MVSVLLLTFAAMQAQETSTRSLATLPIGVEAVIHTHTSDVLAHMLMEMGCIPGELVRIKMIAPFGDPMAIQVAGYYLSIRKKDAAGIMVVIQETEMPPADF